VNEAVAGLNQAQAKATAADALTLLFNSKAPKGAANKKSLLSFQSVLHESFQKNDKENIKTAFQAIIRKKAEMDGGKAAAIKLAVATDSQNPANSANQLPLDGGKRVLNTLIEEMMSNEKTGLSDADLKGIAARVADVLINAANPGSEKKRFDTILFAGPRGRQIETVSAAKIAGILTEAGFDPEAASRMAGNLRKVVLTPEIRVPEKGTGPVCDITASPEKELVDAAVPRGKRPGLSGMEGLMAEQKAQVAETVAQAVRTEKPLIDDEDIKRIAGQIASVVVWSDKAVPVKGSSDPQKSAVPVDVEKETLFKARIADILTGKGFDREAANRVANQINKVILIKEAELSKRADAEFLSDKMVRMEKETPGLVNPDDKGFFLLKAAQSLPVLSAAESRTPIVEGKAVQPSRGEKKELRKDEMPAAAAGRDASLSRKESSVPELSELNALREASLRKDGVSAKEKPFSPDQGEAAEQLAPMGFSAHMPAGHETSVSRQNLRPQEIISQIAELRNAQPDPAGRVKIVLDPPNLGTIEMDIVVRGDRVSAVMTTESSQVRQVLQSHAEEMKQALSHQGFRIDRIEVKQPHEKSPEQWQNPDRQWNQQQDGGYQQKRERNQRWPFAVPESMPELNTVA